MYETVFQLTTRPFSAAPRPEFYFPADSIEHTRLAVERAVRRAAGPALIMGPSGTGKSLLCRVLARQFEPELLIANLASARLCTRRALLQNILFALNRPYRGLEEGELQLSLMDHLQASPGLLLIVDEAQTLPLRLLEELRTFTNLVRDDQPVVHLILAGAMSLEERFANPKLESFNQRVAVRGYLQPLTRSETVAYVHSQLDRAGGKPARLVTREAIDAAYTAADGIPRLLNQLFDHALLLAAAGGRRQLDTDAIQEAWSDLQQLPIPWSAPQNRDEETDDVLEFAELDEQAAEAAWGSVPEPTGEDEKPTELPDEHELDEHPRFKESTNELGQNAGDFDTHEQCGDGSSTPTNVASNVGNEEWAAEAEICPEQAPTGPQTADNGSSVAAAQHRGRRLAAFDLGDPFGVDFEDEEIVVDHYARLLSQAPSGVEVRDKREPQAAGPESPAPNAPPSISVDGQPDLAESARSLPDSSCVEPSSEPCGTVSTASGLKSTLPASGEGPVDVIRVDDRSSDLPGDFVGEDRKDAVPLQVYRENEHGSGPEQSDDSPLTAHELVDTVHELRCATTDAQHNPGRVQVVRPKEVSEDDRDLIIVARRITPKGGSGHPRQVYRQLFANLRDRST